MSEDNRQLIRINYDYANPIDQRRAVGLLNLLILGTSIWFLWLVFLGLPEILREGEVRPLTLGIMSSPILTGVIYICLQRGYLLVASVLFIAGIFPASLFSVANNGVNSSSLIFMAVPIVAAGLLLRPRGYGIVVSIVVFSIAALAVADYETLAQARDDGLFGPLLSLLIIAAFFAFWVGYTDRLLGESRRDLSRYDVIGDFGLSISRDSEDSAIRDALIYLRARLNYNFVQYFGVNETGQLDRRLRARVGASTGVEVSDVHISDVSLLTNSLTTQQPNYVSTSDLPARREHLLPSSAFGLILPVIVDGAVHGVIDIQDNSFPFTRSDKVLIASLTAQLGFIIADLRQVNALRDQLREAETTILNMRRRLRDDQDMPHVGISTEWDTYLQQRGQAAIGYDVAADNRQFVLMQDVPTHMHAALQAGEVIIQAVDDVQQIIVPIRLRDDVIGAMAFELPADRPLNDRRIEMVKDVADQLALALENKRLFERSLNQATRQRKANEIGNRLLSATDLDTLLNIAANSFNEALGAVHTTIQVQPTDNDITFDTTNGSAVWEDGDNV